jgi:predicted N-acetyltransferase YhbS
VTAGVVGPGIAEVIFVVGRSVFSPVTIRGIEHINNKTNSLLAAKMAVDQEVVEARVGQHEPKLVPPVIYSLTET